MSSVPLEFVETSVAKFNVPPSRIWNICFLGHVDHGKSAISDALISANGIISSRSAGKIRYMDFREDEQQRGITMKSSSIALGHRKSAQSPLNIINLIDSPGHVDFTGEVEAALRICDGAVIVVDIVEGVCVQTISVLRAALEHSLRPILVLNKLDRLFGELHLDPMEAYRHIVGILEQVNVIVGIRQVEEMMAADLTSDITVNNTSGWQFDERIINSDGAVSGYFSPELGNVVFASAIDGWAFRIADFANIFSERFGLSKKVLTKTLWGDYYMQAKSKRISRKKPSEVRNNNKPMFVQFILSNIHAIYNDLESTQHDHELAIEKRTYYTNKLGLKIANRDIIHRDWSTALHAIMNGWLPASSCLLDTVTEKLPNAKDAQSHEERLNSFWPNVSRALQASDSTTTESGAHSQRMEAFKRQHDAIRSTSTSSDSSMVAFVAKMIEGDDNSGNASVSAKIRMPKGLDEMNSLRKAAEETDPSCERTDDTSDNQMIAFARIFSGKIQVGDKVYVYSPRYTVLEDGSYDQSTVSTATITGLSLLMGRGTDAVSSVTAGTVLGIHGLDEAVLKTATLSSEPPGLALPVGHSSSRTLGLDKEAVVRVAVEPHIPSDLSKLQKGLRRLNQADPAVETVITAKGEHLIAANGEMHLERCLKDLRERFAKGIRIHVSKPIVCFRETVHGGFSPNVEIPKIEDSTKLIQKENDVNGIRSAGGNMTSTGSQLMRIETNNEPSTVWDSSIIKNGRFIHMGNDSVWFRLAAAPLPLQVANVLEDIGYKVSQNPEENENLEQIIETSRDKILEALKTHVIERESRKSRQERILNYWKNKVLPRIWGCGPRGIGANIIVGPSASQSSSSVVQKLFFDNVKTSSKETKESTANFLKEVEKAMVSGFHLGIRAGPLCEEPMYGVAIFIEEIGFGDLVNGEDGKAVDEIDIKGSGSLVGGMVIGWMREGVRLAVMHGNARILEGMLHADISVPRDLLGKTYTVIGQRRGRVLDEDMKEGVDVFGIKAYIPVEASFGFINVLRKHTSGFAVPQMVLSHWELVDMDPFWFPQTDEELEDMGISDTTAENNNLSRKLINGVRRRKGLKVDEKIVEKAEKQRTLSRKK